MLKEEDEDGDDDGGDDEEVADVEEDVDGERNRKEIKIKKITKRFLGIIFLI